eukprot:973437-Amphidinium_carterae.1
MSNSPRVGSSLRLLDMDASNERFLVIFVWGLGDEFARTKFIPDVESSHHGLLGPATLLTRQMSHSRMTSILKYFFGQLEAEQCRGVRKLTTCSSTLPDRNNRSRVDTPPVGPHYPPVGKACTLV